MNVHVFTLISGCPRPFSKTQTFVVYVRTKYIFSHVFSHDANLFSQHFENLALVGYRALNQCFAFGLVLFVFLQFCFIFGSAFSHLCFSLLLTMIFISIYSLFLKALFRNKIRCQPIKYLALLKIYGQLHYDLSATSSCL